MGEVAPVASGVLVQVSFGSYVATGQMLPIQFAVKNVGTGVMVTEGPTSSSTIFDYNQSDTFASRNYSELTGSWRVGVDYDGNGTGRDHPYRWGLSDALNPGETATINGEITLTQPGAWHYWAGLVQEGVAWAQDRVGTTTVTVGPPLPPRIYIPYSAR